MLCVTYLCYHEHLEVDAIKFTVVLPLILNNAWLNAVQIWLGDTVTMLHLTKRNPN